MDHRSRQAGHDAAGSGRAAALAALRALLESLAESCTVTVDGPRGEIARIHVGPAERPEPPAAPRDDDERDCHADIVAVLEDAGRRLTAEQILRDLQDRSWHHGDSTVRNYLAAMVRNGVLDNDQRAKPPGYRPA